MTAADYFAVMAEPLVPIVCALLAAGLRGLA